VIYTFPPSRTKNAKAAMPPDMITISGSSVVDGYSSAVIRVLWGKKTNNVIIRRMIKSSLKINIRRRGGDFNLISHVYHIFDNSLSCKSHHLGASLIL
jgi:hypothetical protein